MVLEDDINYKTTKTRFKPSASLTEVEVQGLMTCKKEDRIIRNENAKIAISLLGIFKSVRRISSIISMHNIITLNQNLSSNFTGP